MAQAVLKNHMDIYWHDYASADAEVLITQAGLVEKASHQPADADRRAHDDLMVVLNYYRIVACRCTCGRQLLCAA